MSIRNHFPEHGLQMVAAAVVLALGSSAAVAQIPGDEQRPPQQQQQPVGDERADRFDDRDARDTRAFGDEEQYGADGDRQLRSDSGDLAQLSEHENLGTFVKAVKAAGMEEALTDGTTYTVFAPTDDAFDGIDTDALLQSENWEQVAELVRAHIVADDVDPERARNLGAALTIDGAMVEIREADGELTVNGATVVEDNIRVGNIRVYAVDGLLAQAPAAASAAVFD